MKKLGVLIYLLFFSVGTLFAQTTNPPGGNVIIPSGGGTIATRDWVEQFIFNRLGELGLSNCNMTVNSIQEDPVEHSLSFAIGNPIQDVTTYKVEIKKGTASWFYTSIPYQTGQRLTISGIQATGAVLITVSPTGRPSCYASATFTLSGDGGGEISPCTSGPTITSISQITDTTLVAAYTGTGVNSIRYKILNTSGTQVHTATVNPPGSIVGLSFPRLVPGAYTLIFEGLNCTGSSTLGFTVTSPLAACIRGPSILSVNSITSTGATVTFDGLGVSGLAWQIRDGASLIKSGQLNPTSSTFNISYFLGNGTYRLRLLGTTCSGSSETDFTISGGTGGDQTLATGWKYIGQTDTTFLKISVAGSPGAWLISDTAPFVPAFGYEFRYTINDVIVKGSKLTSYAYNSNAVLDVKKWSVKPAVPDNMSTWTVESYGSADNGQTFSERGDVGGQSIIFFKADDNVPGLTWLDTTPSWYQGSHTVSWPTLAPNMNLPPDKYMMFSFKLAGVDQNLRQSKGETFTPDHTDITKRIGIVANLAEAGIPSPSATRDQIRTAADAWPLYGSQAFQWHEGGNNFPQLSTGERYFIERLRERYVAAGRANYVLMAGYGSYDYVTTQIWPNPSNSVNPNSLRWRYTGSKQDLLQSDPYFAHFNGYNNAINTKNYGTNPGLMGSEIIRVAKLQSIKKAGFKAIMFGWGMIEIPDQNAWVKGFGWQTSYPGGKVVIQQNLSQVPFYDAVLNGFNSMWYGDGFWAWDGDGPRNTDPTTIGPTYLPKETTLIGGATVTTGGSSAYKPQPDSGLDGLYIGAALYNQCVETEGGTQFFATFTVGGTTYTAEPDGSDPLTAYSQQRGLTSVRTKDGKATIVYFNPWAGNSWQDFSVNVYGTAYTGKVFGKGLFVANVSLGGLAACPSGPTFFNGNGNGIYETSTTGTRITFAGIGVERIAWTVQDNGTNFDSGEITPGNSTPYITFSSTYQAGHTYTLTIQGASCTSTPSTLSFTVPNQNAPPSGTLGKVLFVGNSITRYGYDPGLPEWNTHAGVTGASSPDAGFGMAASSASNDYVHKIVANYSVSPSDWLIAFGGVHLEQNFTGTLNMSFYDAARAFQPNTIIVRLGENATGVNSGNVTQWKNSVKAVVSNIINGRSGVKVIITGIFWDAPNKQFVDAGLQQAASELGATFIELSSLGESNYYATSFTDAGIRKHPNDAGMAAIANRIITQGIQNTTSSVDAALTAQHYVGISAPNGNVANHLAILDYANTHGYNANGVVFDINDVSKDSDWNIANWNAYDHTSPAAGSHNFDNVVRQYYLSGKKLRVMLPLGRSWNALNGEQSNQTSFWSPSDSHLRLDGTPTYRKATGPVPNDAAPSLATSAVRNYSNGLVYRFFKRYLAAINDGTILCVGLGTEANAEAQMPIDFQDEDGFQINASNPRGGLTNPRGDFNPASISRFKAIFPEYAGASNSDIANADVSTDLGMKFWWHEADLLRETEWAAIDYMKANVPGLTRTRFWAVDAGSHADNLSTVRRTFNIQSRSARPEYVLIKTNDNPAASFAVDYTASAARKINAIPYWEPTPADQGGTSGFILEKDFTISRSIRGKNQGFSFSLLVAANNDITYVIAQGAGIIGLPAPIVPTSTVNLTLYLKDILTKGQHTYVEDQWKAVRTASGKEFVNFTIIDNVKPN